MADRGYDRSFAGLDPVAAVPLHERFLLALEAAAPDVRYEAVLAEVTGADAAEGGMVALWQQQLPDFRPRFEALIEEGRRRPLEDEELIRRLYLYLRELQLLHTDTGAIDRTKAAKRAGVRLADVVSVTDPNGLNYNKSFAAAEAEIVDQMIVALEDKTVSLALQSRDDANAKGWDWRQAGPMTTLLKTRSFRHQAGSTARLEVSGKVEHSHVLEQARRVFGELAEVKHRFLPPPAPRPVRLADGEEYLLHVAPNVVSWASTAEEVEEAP